MLFRSAILLFVACSVLFTPPIARRPRRGHPFVALVGPRIRRLGLRPARQRSQRRSAALEALSALEAELRVGQAPGRALVRAFAETGLAPRAVAAVTWGSDIAAALRADAEATGLPLLRALSACWQVSHSSGAGLADSLVQLIESARAEEEVRGHIDAHLAAPRATARLLASLPVLGLGLGMALGGDPLAWLVSTPGGLACLTGGVLLTVIGLRWTSRIAARVERSLC